jgi:hypothetical protein
MKHIWVKLAIVVVWSVGVRAQTCREITAAAELARAKSLAALRDASRDAGNDYRLHLIRAFRSFQLQPRSKEAAARLLSMVPGDDAQQKIVLTLGDSLCDSESAADMKALAQVNERFARELATAVLIVPSLLPRYLAYSTIAVQDPHSDYAVEMERVCRAFGPMFTRALGELPEDKIRVFTTQVMKADACQPIAIPESDQ